MSSPPHDGYLTGTDRSRNRPYSQGLSFTPRQEAPLPPVDPQRSRPAGVGISFSFQPGSSSARVSAVSKHVQAIHSDRRGLTVAAGDTLIGVNGRDVSGFPPILLREELLGPAGSNVLLRFERGQEGTTVQFEIVAERGFVGQDTTEPPPPPVPPLYHRDVDLKKATVVASRDNFESRLAQARAEVDAARRAQAIAEEGELKMSQENKRLNHLLEHATKTTEELQSANFTRGEEVRSLQMSLLAAQEDVNDGRQSIAWLEDELAKARDVCAAGLPPFMLTAEPFFNGNSRFGGRPQLSTRRRRCWLAGRRSAIAGQKTMQKSPSSRFLGPENQARFPLPQRE
eukprot:1459015-Rhodomonas_salina.6